MYSNRNKPIPRTPFSTPLSGSAREIELRIRGIFSGPRRRPPVLFLALTFAACLLCGNLVSCRQRPPAPSIVMETQYYDSYSNFVEIPTLALPAGEENEAVDAINAGLNALREEYAFAQHSIRGGNHCLLYPSSTDRYLNLTFFLNENSYSHDGWVRSWVYDKKEAVLVTQEDALALAGTTRQALCGDLEALIAADPEDPRGMYEPANIQGFRIKADGQPVFYLSAFVDGRELDNGGYFDEWNRLYVWDKGEFSRYSCMFSWSDGQYPLVPAEETDQLDPPLWNQWYFAGEGPKGGLSPAPASSQAAADLRAVLLGSMTFTDAETGLVLDINRVTEAVTSGADFTAKPVRFAYLDMDMDGTEEAVVWLAAEEGDPMLAFLVLRRQEDGQVYSYTRFPRTLSDLKQDGIYTYSLSGAEFGLGYAQFIPSQQDGGPDRWETNVLLKQEPADESWERLSWFYGNGPVSETDFHALYQEQMSKEDASWHDFTPELIERVIS